MQKPSATALEGLSAPREIVVDQSTGRRLEELCSQMTDTCGQVECTLQLAIEDESEKRVAYLRTALKLSARGRKAIKMFLSEWGVLVQESKIRENSGRSARDSELVVLTSITAHAPATRNETHPS